MNRHANIADRDHRCAQGGHADAFVSSLPHYRLITSADVDTRNLINNARFVGGAMGYTPDDIICCPPPLFHCFGLVLGFLASFCHGSSIVFPSDYFDVRKVMDSVIHENVTILLGVPTMYVNELEVIAQTGQRPRCLRAVLASGAPVPQMLMDSLRHQMGVDKTMIAYGMTETSPVTFITDLDDFDEKRSTTVGRVAPHTAAKVVDQTGKTLPRGQRGELCTSGYALQKGYWRNETKTKDVMKTDDHGVCWMHTGDEAFIDDEGYAHITGRIKDIIIRGKQPGLCSSYHSLTIIRRGEHLPS